MASRHPILWISLLAGLLLAACPQVAAAGTVEVGPDQSVVYVAAPGETNTITVDEDEGGCLGCHFVIRDTTAPITPGASCFALPSGWVGCSVVPGRIELDLGDGNDSIAVVDRWSSGATVVRDGDGDDAITSLLTLTMVAGMGADDHHAPGTVDYGARLANVAVTMDDVANDGEAGEGDDIGPGVRTVLTGAGDDTIDFRRVAGWSRDFATTGPGDDVVTAGTPSVELTGGTGADTLLDLDGVGAHLAVYAERTQPVVVKADGLPSSGETGEGDTWPTSLGAVTGGAGADQIWVGAGMGTVTGGEGDDTVRSLPTASGQITVFAGAGDDLVVATNGSWQVRGEDGDDRLESQTMGTTWFVGDDGSDVVSFAGSPRAARTPASPNRLVEGSGWLLLSGASVVPGSDSVWAETVVGSDFGDRILSTNRVEGGDGDDELSAPGTLVGGDGNDVLLGKHGSASALDCGAGVDTAYTDEGDDTTDCEHGAELGPAAPGPLVRRWDRTCQVTDPEFTNPANPFTSGFVSEEHRHALLHVVAIPAPGASARGRLWRPQTWGAAPWYDWHGQGEGWVDVGRLAIGDGVSGYVSCEGSFPNVAPSVDVDVELVDAPIAPTTFTGRTDTFTSCCAGDSTSGDASIGAVVPTTTTTRVTIAVTSGSARFVGDGLDVMLVAGAVGTYDLGPPANGYLPISVDRLGADALAWQVAYELPPAPPPPSVLTVRRGTAAANRIVGTARAERIFGLGGNDSLFGAGGNDSIWGGLGNDLVSGGTGNDYLSGGPGADTLLCSSGVDVALGDAGNDVIRCLDSRHNRDRIDCGPGLRDVAIVDRADRVVGCERVYRRLLVS